jgi:hypothetical protein
MWRNHFRDNEGWVYIGLCFYRNSLSDLECCLGLMKGFGERTGAGSVLKERRKVRPRNTFLEKLAEMTKVSSIEGRDGHFTNGQESKSSVRRQRA